MKTTNLKTLLKALKKQEIRYSYNTYNRIIQIEYDPYYRVKKVIDTLSSTMIINWFDNNTIEVYEDED